MTPRARVEEALAARGCWRARGWCCPAHEDNQPSLSLSEGKDGRILLHCHAGCAIGDIVEAAGLEWRDLFSDNGDCRAPQIVATYDYTDEQDTLQFEVVRFRPKAFRQRRPQGDGWAWNLKGVRRVLYRLPRVREAVRDRRRVFVVEGEKDVHAHEEAGEIATCNPGGAGKWRDEYSAALAGASVVVVADQDEPGRRHAEQVAASVGVNAREVRVVKPRSGKDAADHLAAGFGPDEFEPVEDLVVRRDEVAASNATKSNDTTSNDTATGGLLIRASDVRVEPVRFLWDPYAPLGATIVLAGIGGLGKSHLGLEIAARVTRGQLTGDLEGSPADVIVATAEDSISHTATPRLIAAGGDLERVSFVRVAERGFAIPDDLAELSEAMESRRVRFVLVDPLVAFLPLRIDSHKDQHARVALAPLAALADRHDAAIAAVLHLNKASEAGSLFLRVSGSVGFLNAARSALLVAEDPDDDGHRVAAHGKHNLTAPGASLGFRIEGTDVECDGVRARTSRLVWLGESSHGVGELLRSDHRRDPRQGAERLLVGLLADGPVAVSEIDAAAEAAGHAWRTVRRAKDGLDIQSRKTGLDCGWEWHLPAAKVASTEKWTPSGIDRTETAGQLEDVHVSSDERPSSAGTNASLVGGPAGETRLFQPRELISHERARGYDDGVVATLLASMPRSFPPPPEGFERWTPLAVQVAMGEAG